MTVNNFDIVRTFIPGGSRGLVSNGDHFLYTEILDRTKRVGNNGVRIKHTYYHRSLEDFDRHFAEIQQMCDGMKVRAYTRLAPRSFKKVGKKFTALVVDAALTDNWAGMKTLYQRACGTVTPEQKYWLFDVDTVTPASEQFGTWLLAEKLLEAVVPSKRFYHYVAKPFDLRRWSPLQDPTAIEIHGVPDMSLHKDNAVNLYIPDGAA